ncbi:YpjP family protein [Halobacillus sp. A5]|uniref:YpjP family protein n=1 Tax=Halobacillus sp. A5 TaxID=2880263 RepID=UPI0020A6DA30|nr:YpjP family protein [Halobacillus sp. A5]MCP3028963.1 YpjP family protein [Halobacillus sp. A5]
MKLWFRKIFVVFVAIMTLGMYIPPTDIEMDASEKKEVSSKEDTGLNFADEEAAEPGEPEGLSSEDYIHSLTAQAKDRMISKMGPRIIDKVEADFEHDILPKMEEVIDDIVSDSGTEEVSYYEITEQVTSGYGEKVFTIIDARTKEEVARFDVRRDNRPGDGYWFNFHYHLSEDQFEEHHPLGEIYWDKNTPPKWMS